MKTIRFTLILLCGIFGAHGTLNAQPANTKPAKHALLIGVTKYPYLNERLHLEGPANDVLLLRDLMIKQFAFPKENVTILSEAEGKRDDKLLPSRAAIKREFERLAQIAQPGDQIIIMMGGLGSQQPEPENSRVPRPGGLNDIFLPRDVKDWVGDEARIPNAIIDGEVADWLKSIQEKKAFIWIIIDSCNAGSMIRGAAERARQISPTSDLKIPGEAIQLAQQRAAKRFPNAKAEPTRAALPQGGIVAIYACQPNEVTVEREMPMQSKDARQHGLLSYTIAQILTQAHQNGGKPPTYRELAQLINSRYRAMGRNAPTPQIEGAPADRNREVLGTESWQGRSNIFLSREGDGWKINAGTLHGVTAGSILAVKLPADHKDAEKIVGHVRVAEVKMLSSAVVPCAFGKMDLHEKLPTEGRCEMVQLDFGVKKLRIGVDSRDGADKSLPKATAQKLAKALDEIVAQRKTMLQKADSVDEADWLLRWHADKVYLIPALEWSQKLDASSDGTRFGPFAEDDKLADTLRERFQRIVRAENFKKIVGATANDFSRDKTNGGLRVGLNVVRYTDAKDPKGISLPLDAGRIQVHHNDTITIMVHNPNPFAVDLTILYIDSGYGIDPYYPDPSRAEINRVPAGDTLIMPKLELDGSKTHGFENLVVIAIKAKSKELVDFLFMAQPTLELAVKVRGEKRGPKTPLESLLESNVLGAGSTRGIDRLALEDFALRIVPWQLSPQVRAKSK